MRNLLEQIETVSGKSKHEFATVVPAGLRVFELEALEQAHIHITETRHASLQAFRNNGHSTECTSSFRQSSYLRPATACIFQDHCGALLSLSQPQVQICRSSTAGDARAKPPVMSVQAVV